MELDLVTFLMLGGIGLAAGCIDSIAGGGGLLTIPALLATGMAPTQALATNKLQSSFGSFSATWYYYRRGILNLVEMRQAVICTFVGSAAGTLLVQQIDPAFLGQLLPLLLALFALYFLLSPRLSDDDSQRRLDPKGFALLAGTGIGFYDGFFGPGTGSFFAIAFVSLAGFSMRRATAHTKLLNFTSNLASLLFFILGGKVVWLAGLSMALGQFIGARLGSRLVVRLGVRLVKPLLITVSVVMCTHLLWQQHPHWFAYWLS